MDDDLKDLLRRKHARRFRMEEGEQPSSTATTSNDLVNDHGTDSANRTSSPPSPAPQSSSSSSSSSASSSALPHSEPGVPNPQLKQEDENASDAKEGGVSNAVHEDNSAEEDACRICGGGAEEGNRLFSPCRCKGTIRLVHVQCINEWRRLSTNPAAYYECSLCKYRYHIARTQLATYMQSLRVAEVATLLFCALTVLVAGLVLSVFSAISVYLSYPSTANALFNLLEWVPFWVYPESAFFSLSPSLNFLFDGVIGVGAIGFAADSYQAYCQQDYNRFYGLGISLAANGARMLRIWAVVGTCYSFRFVWRVTKRFSLQVLHKWGERLLDVPAEEAEAT